LPRPCSSGMPLLPVMINGSRHARPKGSLVFRSGIIELVLGDPFETAGKTDDDREVLVRTPRRMNQSGHPPEQS